MAVIDGRPEVVDEVLQAPSDVRTFLRDWIQTVLASPEFLNVLEGHVEAGRGSIVLQRLRSMLGGEPDEPR